MLDVFASFFVSLSASVATEFVSVLILFPLTVALCFATIKIFCVGK